MRSRTQRGCSRWGFRVTLRLWPTSTLSCGPRVRTILLPSGHLLVPVELDDPADGFGLRELGPEHPEYGRYLAFAEPGEDLRLCCQVPGDCIDLPAED
jgi:hypothetical protein